jgi:preprotein translocase subunit SecA
MRELERRVVLSVLDRKWREHLYEMDYLREGIGLRGYGQRDPLIEYQREGYDMFNAMMEGIKEESVGLLFNAQVQFQENPIVEELADDTVPPGFGANGAPQPTGMAGQGMAPPGRAAQPTPAQQPTRPAATPGRPAPRTTAPRTAPAPAQRSGGGAHARPAGSAPGAPSAPVPAGLAPRRSQRMQYSGPTVDGGGSRVETSGGPADGGDFDRVGRNDPCPCGSGRKFKRCHGDPRMRPDL